MYYSKLKKNGYSIVNIPKFLYSEIKEDILKILIKNFPIQELNSYQSLTNFFVISLTKLLNIILEIILLEFLVISVQIE